MLVVRPAALADVPAIVAIHCADILAWKRRDENGAEYLANYADLRPYERWMNGGPWLDESTFGAYLARLLQPESGAVALVAEMDGQVRAVAEAVVGEEPAYGRCMDIGVIYTLRGFAGRGLGSALMETLDGHARQAGCETVLVTHAEAPGFYARHGFKHAETWRRVRLPVRASQTTYSAQLFSAESYQAVRGWAMPVGRYQAARQEWNRIQPGAEPAFEEWRGLRTERWQIEARRTPARLVLDELPRMPGVADVHLWLDPAGQGLSRQMMRAVRDRAARSGFRSLHLLVSETTLAQLEPGWHADGYKQELWRRPATGR
jgi:GNAT superfamily N-acetyltransferase